MRAHSLARRSPTHATPQLNKHRLLRCIKKQHGRPAPPSPDPLKPPCRPPKNHRSSTSSRRSGRWWPAPATRKGPAAPCSCPPMRCSPSCRSSTRYGSQNETTQRRGFAACMCPADARDTSVCMHHPHLCPTPNPTPRSNSATWGWPAPCTRTCSPPRAPPPRSTTSASSRRTTSTVRACVEKAVACFWGGQGNEIA